MNTSTSQVSPKQNVFIIVLKRLAEGEGGIVGLLSFLDKDEDGVIWWDDLLIISDFETILIFIKELKAKLNTEHQKLLDYMLSKPETFLSIDKHKITETSVAAIDFISFIKDSDWYLEKENKFV